MPRPAPSSPRSSALDILPKGAARLLAALAEPGLVAMPDPSRDDVVILRGSRGGVSLGRGSHDKASLDHLAARDLVETEGRPDRHVLSATGRAWLAREKSRRDGEGGEAFARQHREPVTARLPSATGSDTVNVNARESPLAWLRRRKGPDGEPLIDSAAFEAGERLRRDITFAGLLPSVTARWDGAIGGGGGARDPASAADSVIAARQRVRAAMAAVGGDFADLLLDLCGFLKGVETIERERHWPQRSGKIVIRLALGQLARHYGLSNEASGRGGSAGIRTWFAELEAA